MLIEHRRKSRIDLSANRINKNEHKLVRYRMGSFQENQFLYRMDPKKVIFILFDYKAVKDIENVYSLHKTLQAN